MTRSSVFDASASSRLQLESAIRSSQRARQLTEQDAALVLSYCKWLRKREFQRQSNETRAKCGLPPSSSPVFLDQAAASQIYQLIAQEIRSSLGYALLGIGEPNAVEAAVMTRKAPSSSLGQAGAKGRMKRAELQLSRIQKFVGGGKRVIRGIASTPSTDRMGDIVEPLGGTWKLPLPLLWNHHHDHPIGWVRSAKASRAGIEIEAEFAEGIGKADEVWRMVELGLLDSFSIGFRTLAVEPIATGVRFTSWELYEVSVVTVPANADAKIRRSQSGSTSSLGSTRSPRKDGVPLVAASVRLLDGKGAVKLGGGR